MTQKLLLSLAILATIGLSALATETKCKNAPLPANTTVEHAITISSPREASANLDKALSLQKDFNKLATSSQGASYMHPQGFFYWGLSSALTGYNNFIIGSAFANATWKNTSSKDSETFKWDYVDPGTGKWAESSDVDLTVYYPFVGTKGPTLTATAAESATSSYNKINYISAGGAASNKGVDFGACTYDSSSGLTSMSSYFGQNGDDRWTAAFNLTGDDKAVVKSLLNYYAKPAHSYFISKAWIQASVKADPDTEFKMTIKKANEDGSVGDAIATGTALMSEAIINGNITTLTFKFFEEDPTTGLIEEGIYTIDSAIYLELTGFKSEKVSEFSIIWMDEVYDNTNTNSFVNLDITQGGVTNNVMLPSSILPFDGMNGKVYCTDYMFNTNATFTWFESDENEFIAPIEGGSKTFSVNAYYYSEAWIVKEEQNETLPEWITYSTTDDEVTEMSTLTFNVAALPEGITGRSFDVTMTIPGTTKVYRISQGSGGIGGVTVSDIKATSVSGDFVINYPATINAVSIFNISGQMVKDVRLTDAGSTTISAQDLAKGVYILKFNDNRTIKLIK